MGTTRELVEHVRQLVHEYQVDPITDAYVVARLNEAYTFAYNHYVKANDEIFGEIYFLPVVAGQSEYDLPSNLWSKRLEKLFVPTPPNEASDPWGWAKIKKIAYSQSYALQTNRIRTYYPVCWSTLNNKLYIFPNPIQNYSAKLLISRKIPRLGVYSGRITQLDNNKIFLDEFNDSALEDNAGYNEKAFISICDVNSGEVKAIYSYSSVDTVNKFITLQTSPRKYASILTQGLTITAVTAGTTYEAINITFTAGGTAGAEVVTVNGYNISVQVQSGVSTTAQVRTAILASVPAAALIGVVVTTAGTVSSNSALYLMGGDNKYLGNLISELPGTQWGTVNVDDVVCVGYTTGISIFGDAFDSFLKDWAVMRIRGALNETDPETVNSLKLQLQELSGDLASRNMGIRIEMTERNNYGGHGFRR